MNSDLAKPDDAPRETAGLLRRLVGPGLAILAGLFVLAVMHHLSRSIDYHSMVRALRVMPATLLWQSIAWTAISFLALVGRDWCALRYAGARVPASALFLASFCGSALGNAVGFGGTDRRGRTLSHLRRRWRPAGADRPDHGLHQCRLRTGPGRLRRRRCLARRRPRRAYPRLVGNGAASRGLGVDARRRCGDPGRGTAPRPIGIGRLSIDVPGPGLLLLQIALTALDLVGAAAALWVLLPMKGLGLADFSAIFAAATALGVISHVPGGIGVFEAVILYSLGRHVAPSIAAAAADRLSRDLFRPAAAAFGRVAGRGRGWRAPIRCCAAPAVWRRSSSARSPSRSASCCWSRARRRPSPSACCCCTTCLPLWVVETSHFLGSVAGVLLLFVARGLFHRLDGAWWLGITIAVASLVLSLAKGMAYGEAAIILCLILLLLATRRHFTRRTSLLRQPFTVSWFAAVALVLAGSAWVLFFAFRDVAYAHEMWWQFEFDAQAPRSLRALLGAALLAAAASLWQLLRPAAGRVAPPDADTLARAAAVISGQERAEAMLGLMGDKSFLFSASGQALLMYAKRGRSWVALFDPIGPRAEWAELIWRFIELADEHGGRAAFYQVRSDSLPLYLDAGLKVMKLGEEARLALDAFDLKGGQRSGLRYALKRGERGGAGAGTLAPRSGPGGAARARSDFGCVAGQPSCT
ncbi:MAG: phosphatidylglycerol lysyltransferase domain-containing protein [Aliidongia sp.]